MASSRGRGFSPIEAITIPNYFSGNLNMLVCIFEIVIQYPTPEQLEVQWYVIPPFLGALHPEPPWSRLLEGCLKAAFIWVITKHGFMNDQIK